MENEQKGAFHNIGTAFAGIWNKREGLSLKSVRPAMLFYVLAYTFELMFYAYHKTFLHTDAKLFGIGANMLMYIGHILMSLVIMLLWSAKFKRLIHTSVVITLLGFLAFMIVPDGIPKLLCAVLTMVGIGGCVTSARCGFAFAANNAERLLCVVLALGGRAILNFADTIFPDGSFADNILFTYIFPAIILIGLAVCLLRYRETDFKVKEETTTEDSHGLYWAFAIFIAFFAIEGYTNFMMTDGYANANLMYGIGKLLAIAIFVCVLILLKKNIWHILNVFFACCIIMAVLANFSDSPVLNAPIHILAGFFEIGWLAVLYTLGCAQRRFASYKLLKKCTIIFVIISPITTLSDELFGMFFAEHTAVITLAYVLLFAIAFLMVSPSASKYLFSAAWIDDLNKLDMTLYAEAFKQAEKIDEENTLNLTPREMEIFTLLLTDVAYKHISATLDISENTVKFHSKNLYRKLNIQSRTELFAKYGQKNPSV